MKKNELVYSGDPQRLDIYLSEAGLGFSRPFAQRIISEGRVTVNGSIRKPGYILKEGAKVEVIMPEASGKNKKDFEKLVIYEDQWIIAIHKPAGLAVHPNSPHWETNPEACLIGEPTVVSMLLEARPETAEKGLSRLGLVHRLDRDTSGLMIISRDPEIQTALQADFRDRLMEKTYIGCVSPVPVEESGIIDAPIGRAGGFKKIKVWEFGRDAITCYRIKEKSGNCAMLEIEPQTGRTNQIRIHMEHMGCPILGDKLYHGLPADRMLLHSAQLIFTHPATGKKKKLKCPLPDDFKTAWDKAKKEI
jgi:23S rRNA pseudouridine1911/1915/1917 synthase